MATQESLPADETGQADESGQSTAQAAGPTGDAGGEDSPWGTLVFGLLMIAGAVWIYWYFGKLEAEGGEVRMPAIAWLLYDLVGRTGLAAIAALIGAFATWAGISDLRKPSA